MNAPDTKLHILEGATQEMTDSARLRRMHELAELVAITLTNFLLVTSNGTEATKVQREALLTMYFSCAAVLYGPEGLKVLARDLTNGASDAMYAARAAGVSDEDIALVTSKKKGSA
jgi:hypothetical protein